MAVGKRKVVVIGAGSVGTSYIYALLWTGLSGEIALIDIDSKRVEGEILDLSHGLPFIPPVHIKAGEYSDCSDADLIVVTAGSKQSPGQGRMQLIQKNAEIIRSICEQIGKYPNDALLLMVTNPVDSLTQLAIQQLGWSRRRVFGSGTVLDTSRFRYMLSRHCNIDARNVHAYILGEHGDSEVAAWSMTHIAGTPMAEHCAICQGCDYKRRRPEIAEQVRESAYHIIDYKGSTFYAIGLALVRISEAVLRNENSVLTVSTLLQGEYNINDVCVSVPCVVGDSGIRQVIQGPLNPQEQQGLENSAATVRKAFDSISSQQPTSTG